MRSSKNGRGCFLEQIGVEQQEGRTPEEIVQCEGWKVRDAGQDVQMAGREEWMVQGAGQQVG